MKNKRLTNAIMFSISIVATIMLTNCLCEINGNIFDKLYVESRIVDYLREYYNKQYTIEHLYYDLKRGNYRAIAISNDGTERLLIANGYLTEMK